MASQTGKAFRFTAVKKLFGFLGDLFKKLFSPVTRITEDVAADYHDSSPIKKTLIGFIKLRYAILLAVVLIVLFGGYFFAVRNDGSANAVMSLNYEESAKGLTPNSTRFNIYELKSADVVERMLDYCGIDRDSVDVDKIVDLISINTTNTKGFSSEDYYIATSYSVSIKKIPGVKDVSTHDLLTYLCRAYTDVFYEHYADNRSILSFDVSEFEGMEYLHVADMMALKAQQQSKYLNTRVKENKTFTDGVSSETFKSLAVKLEDFQSYDIERYRAYVLQTGIARNKAHFLRVLNYIVFVDTLAYNKDMASYEIHYDGVGMYNSFLTSEIMIPTIDRDNSTYYMSKTKTGMDYVTARASRNLNTAQEVALKNETNEHTMQKLQAGRNARADLEKADRMIADMQAKFIELGKQIEALDKAYIKYKTKDYITFQIKGLSLQQRLRVDLLLDLSILFVAGAFTALWIKFRYFGKGDKK